MNKYIGLSLAGGLLFILHVGFMPQAVLAKPNAFQVQLQIMLKDCVDNKHDHSECKAIERVITKSSLVKGN